MKWLKNAKKLLVKNDNPLIKYEKIINKIENFFGTKLKIIFVNTKLTGEENEGIIKIGLKNKEEEIIEYIIHEAIHAAWGADHDYYARKAKYLSSYDKESHDYFSRFLAEIIFCKQDEKNNKTTKKQDTLKEEFNDAPEYCKYDCEEWDKKPTECELYRRRRWLDCKKKPLSKSRILKKIEKSAIRYGMTQ